MKREQRSYLVKFGLGVLKALLVVVTLGAGASSAAERGLDDSFRLNVEDPPAEVADAPGKASGATAPRIGTAPQQPVFGKSAVALIDVQGDLGTLATFSFRGRGGELHFGAGSSAGSGLGYTMNRAG